MGLESSPVATGQKVLALQYNNLRKDLLVNHTHTDAGGEGGVISHEDLTDGAVSGTGITHENIDKHVTGDLPGTFADNPGGSAGVHGLVAAAFVGGTAGMVTQGEDGTATLVPGQLVVVAGHYTPATNKEEHTISFGMTFTSPPSVVVSPVSGVHGPGDYSACLKTISVDEFVCDMGAKDYGVVPGIYWIAIGVKS